jgi:hypothetical protein
VVEKIWKKSTRLRTVRGSGISEWMNLYRRPWLQLKTDCKSHGDIYRPLPRSFATWLHESPLHPRTGLVDS